MQNILLRAINSKRHPTHARIVQAEIVGVHQTLDGNAVLPYSINFQLFRYALQFTCVPAATFRGNVADIALKTRSCFKVGINTRTTSLWSGLTGLLFVNTPFCQSSAGSLSSLLLCLHYQFMHSGCVLVPVAKDNSSLGQNVDGVCLETRAKTVIAIAVLGPT